VGGKDCACLTQHDVQRRGSALCWGQDRHCPAPYSRVASLTLLLWSKFPGRSRGRRTHGHDPQTRRCFGTPASPGYPTRMARSSRECGSGGPPAHATSFREPHAGRRHLREIG
jgi:hypothetical protein